ncbi:MAG: hypothetical protein HYU86_05770 [Chloroflexi bacterium]|nr:hypothetical protein [Chloroflexota bacterium]
MSTTKLNTIRVVLAINTLIALFFGLSMLFMPQQTHEGFFKESFNPAIQGYMTFLGSSALAMVVGGVIALLDPPKNLGLIKFFIAFGLLDFLVSTVYVNLVVVPDAAVSSWIFGTISLILAVVLIVVYPRGQEAS